MEQFTIIKTAQMTRAIVIYRINGKLTFKEI
jgi:hypothetical protein